MSICRLCCRDPENEPWNAPLFESQNFTAIPSLGSMIEGWVLLLPKQHYLCMGALPAHLIDEMEDLKRTIVCFLREVYGSVCLFEHGPHIENSLVGCGVDHAHLHLLPVGFDLRSAAAPLLPEDVVWRKAPITECRRAFTESKAYLYLEQPIGHGFIATHDKFKGQLFRQAIASHLGILSNYNWREFAYLDKVEATIARARIWEKDQACPTKIRTAA